MSQNKKPVTGTFVIFSILILVSLGGCARNPGQNTVICMDDEYSSYPEALWQILPSHIIERSDNPAYQNLEKAGTAEAFASQAVPALEVGIAEYWYPQYLATVIIAVDRDRTDAAINGWNDLLSATVREEVGYIDAGYLDNEMLMAAISYGLEGENFTLKKAASLLRTLNEQKRFVRNSYEPPVVVCYDYNAAELIKNGGNIEIIVPVEGTLTYERGLLSGAELELAGDADNILLAAGFRLPGGRFDPALYPGESAYENARTVTDYDYFNTVILEATRIYRREVLRVRLYTSADGREHQYFVLIYIVIIVVWVASAMNRAAQKGVRRAAAAAGMILLGWIILRLLSYQLPGQSRLWFGYYIFQLSLPPVILWLAWVIDRPDEKKPVLPVWLRLISAANGLLILTVLTNDLHNWVFRIDLSNPNWPSEYGYGFVFYTVQAGCYIPLVAGVFMMLYKGRHSLKKSGIVFILGLFGLLIAFTVGYIMRFPIAWESDYTMVAGVFALMLFETALRSGMIPVNSKYKKLFMNSTLCMRIIDNEKRIQSALNSASAVRCDQNALADALKSYPKPARQGENTLLFAAPITGGYALWQEDIAGLNRLHKETEQSVNKLKTANAVLAAEKNIKQSVHEEIEKNRLMAQLEEEIAEFTVGLSAMIDQLENAADKKKAMARITLLLCYIKRRCNLFFREKEARTLPADELTVYLDELAEMAGYANVKVIVTNEITKRIPVRHATLFYDFFNNVICRAASVADIHILAHLGIEDKNSVLRLLLPFEGAHSFQMNETVMSAIASAGGVYTTKDLDDAVGLSLSFPEGGGGIG